mmetsp:Transcript_4140/g.10370  ORF Transcript_4140/g.10370 Transcript_4140/m.10370 type:complete len:216 (-) Transcript_4140:34-681(-)
MMYRSSYACFLILATGCSCSMRLYRSMQSFSRPHAWYASASHSCASPPSTVCSPSSSTARSSSTTLAPYSPHEYASLPSAKFSLSFLRASSSSLPSWITRSSSFSLILSLYCACSSLSSLASAAPSSMATSMSSSRPLSRPVLNLRAASSNAFKLESRDNVANAWSSPALQDTTLRLCHPALLTCLLGYPAGDLHRCAGVRPRAANSMLSPVAYR